MHASPLLLLVVLDPLRIVGLLQGADPCYPSQFAASYGSVELMLAIELLLLRGLYRPLVICHLYLRILGLYTCLNTYR